MTGPNTIMNIKVMSCLLLFVASVLATAAEQSPYSGQKERRIKSLSQSDIDGYLAGGGMGYAKAAELNHYPGPKHVLELAVELGLDEQQMAETAEIYWVMQQQAANFGRQLVEKEDELDQLFNSRVITRVQLKKRLSEIAALKAVIRFVHLDAHLEQKTVLSEKQAQHYDQLRGYTNGHGAHQH